MLKLYGRKDSSNVQAVRWCLEELGLEYSREDRGHRFGGLDTAEYRAMNPHGKVPVLVHDDHPALFESGAILRYLANVFGPESFWPKDPMARAQIDKWAEWAKISLALSFTHPIFWKRVRTAPSKQNPTEIANAVREFESQLAVADDQLATRPFLANTDFTLADIQLGHILYRYYDMVIERAALPNVRAYYNRLTERAAYREAVMVSYAALAVGD